MRFQLSFATLLTLCAAGCSMLPGGDRSVESFPEYSEARREVEGRQFDRDRDVEQASFEQADESILDTLNPLNAPDNARRTYQRITGTEPNRQEAEALFREAETLYRSAAAHPNGDVDGFLEAAAKYEEAGKRWPDSALEQDAMFMQGEALFFASTYPEAIEAYEMLLKKYPNSRYIDQVDVHRFAIARYWLNSDSETAVLGVNAFDEERPWRDTFGHAVRVFNRIRLDDPTGRLSDDATLAAANAYFLRKKYIQADEYYTDLRRTFPSSEHQFLAHLLGMKSKLLSYQGADYSEKPLVDAEQLVKQLRKQFPDDYAKNREEIELAYAEIRKRMAERHWRTAKYYDRRKEFGAARYYYAMIGDEYRNTPIAEQANTRLAELGGRPDEPEQKMKWLANLFPRPTDGDLPQPRTAQGTSDSATYR